MFLLVHVFHLASTLCALLMAFYIYILQLWSVRQANSCQDGGYGSHASCGGGGMLYFCFVLYSSYYTEYARVAKNVPQISFNQNTFHRVRVHFYLLPALLITKLKHVNTEETRDHLFLN